MGVAGLWLAGAIAAAGAEPGLRVFRVYVERPEQVRELAEFDLWEYESGDAGYVLVAVELEEYAALADTGLRLELDTRLTDLARAPRATVAGQVTGIPGFPCYRTVEETYLTAQQMVWSDPTLASWLDVGDSWEKTTAQGGYDLRVLRLTNNAIPGPKPKLFITSSSMHASTHRRSWRLASRSSSSQAMTSIPTRRGCSIITKCT